MDVMKAIYQRRAIRAYTAQEVGEDCIEDLIDAAVQAPSAMNAQPWAFTATTDRALLARIAAEVRRHLLDTAPPGSPLLRLMPGLLDERCDVFHGAPALVVLSATSNDPWADADCGMAAQNFMLAACARKLGSCCIGLARSWLALPASKQLLGIPAAHRPLLPIVVGHPQADAIASTPRRAPQIHWVGSERLALA